MHEFWTILTAHMTYSRSQNYTNMMVDKHEIQTFKVVVVIVVVVVVIDVWSQQMHTPHYF